MNDRKIIEMPIELPLEVAIDRQCSALYLRYQPSKPKIVAQTVEHGEWVNVDYDANGKLVGIEMLCLPQITDLTNDHGRFEQRLIDHGRTVEDVAADLKIEKEKLKNT